MADDAAMLLKLGYSRLWLDCGLLTADFLANQHQQFETSDDKHTEHYRYGAFRHYLAGKTELTDQELANYLHLALTEQDALMGGAATKDLFTEVSLTDNQFAEVCTKLDELPGDWTAAVLDRQRLLRRLAAGSLDSALFADCLRQGDSVVQKALLRLSNPSQLAELAIQGRTKSIRNAAAEKARPS